MKPLKVLQIGHQHDHGRQVFNSLTHFPEYFDIVGLATTDIESAKKIIKNANRYMTIEEALEIDDLDAVIIECEEENSLDIALLFAKRGAAVHLDKPGSADNKKISELVNTLRDKNKVFHTGYMYRYNPVVQKLLKMINDGELGEIFSVEAQMSVRHPKEKRLWLGKHKGGMMYFLGCHLIDLVLQICGKPNEIIPLNTSTHTDGLNTEDYGFCVFKYNNGVSFIKTCAAEYNGFARRQFVVSGTKGTVELKPFELLTHDDCCKTGYAITLEKSSPTPWFDSADNSTSEEFERYDTMMREFAKYVLGEKQNPYTYDYEIMLHKTILECCEVK